MSVHVYPVDDLRKHVKKGWRCECRPSVEAVKGECEHGEWFVSWLVTHNSFDGRENWNGGPWMTVVS